MREPSEVRMIAEQPIIDRHWSMPSKNTFEMRPALELIEKYRKGLTIDPFGQPFTAGEYHK